MPALNSTLRSQLESTVKKARELAETAARSGLSALGVDAASPPAHLTPAQRALRNQLRARGKQLGDERHSNGTQTLTHLVWDTAYEHWHQMLFARFLAENGLLMHPDGVAVTLKDCAEMVEEGSAKDFGATTAAGLAATFATAMLPQIFRPQDPVLAVQFAKEHQKTLDELLEKLPVAVFTADDSLGWVYQFWQTQRKKEVNESEVKIGADELPAVTQLFTEPYMVQFLLHNSLGAWWAAKRIPETLWTTATSEAELRTAAAQDLGGYEFTYLRFKVDAASRRVGLGVGLDGLDGLDGLGDPNSLPNPDAPPQTSPPSPVLYDRQSDHENLKGNLPHWRQGPVTYFVTFRTADSLPKEKLDQWLKEQAIWLKNNPEPHDESLKAEYHRLFPDRIQYWLDQQSGECLLAKPDINKIVEDALRHFDGQRYHLDHFTVASNHVHVVVTPIPGHELSEILHSWKSFTGHQINKTLNREGSFWQKESFDHIVRSLPQLERIRKYIDDHSRRGVPPRSESNSNQTQNSNSDTNPNPTRRDAASTLNWTPAAGTFATWPKCAKDLTTLDPCCGSGHFLVALLHLLTRMRMAEESLSPAAAINAVLRDNLHGLEIDPRCTQIAAFAVALAAWTFPGSGGYRPLPAPHIACCGLRVAAKREEWIDLADRVGGPEKSYLCQGMGQLWDTFQQAPVLGSLLDPGQASTANLFSAGWEELQPLLNKALGDERLYDTEERTEIGVAAKGLADAANLLTHRYHLVVTNVPYLARGKQNAILAEYCEKRYPTAKADLANVFLERCLELSRVAEASSLGGSGGTGGTNQRTANHRATNQRTANQRLEAAATMTAGVVQVVMPQNWLFLTSYRKQRENLLKTVRWNLLGRLGEGAFDSPQAAGAFIILLTQTATAPQKAVMAGIDASGPKNSGEKAEVLEHGELATVEQIQQLGNPDARVSLDIALDDELLGTLAETCTGIQTFDSPRFLSLFWEYFQNSNIDSFISCQTTVESSIPHGGKSQLLRWENGVGGLAKMMDNKAKYENYKSGIWKAWLRYKNSTGVCISLMRELPVSLFTGFSFDNNTGVVIPTDPSHLPAIWCFCSSPDFNIAVRKIDQKLNVTNATLVKVPFDLPHWQQVAAEKYPHGLPKPYSNDPTQWIFHGHPCGNVVWDETSKWTAQAPLRRDATVLHTALARLLGYQWPAEGGQGGSGFQPLIEKPEIQEKSEESEKSEDKSQNQRLEASATLADEQQYWVNRCAELQHHADVDGIVCLAAVAGERPAADRLRDLLVQAYGSEWSPTVEGELLAQDDSKNLEDWLRDKAFAGHVKLFQNRPFVWHIWDGRKDGFHAFVNYHKFDNRLLERLIHTYLADWMDRQEHDAKAGKPGADLRLAAAQELRKKLLLIHTGESPYDIFVRWKPLSEQPIGWHPDLNDGVRLNIRPWIEADILRVNLKTKIKYGIDRGKDPEGSPWGPDRDNDKHFTLAEKQAAKVAAKVAAASSRSEKQTEPGSIK